MNYAKVLLFVAVLTMTPSISFGVTDGDLKKEAKPNDAKVRDLAEKLEDSSLDEEVEQADTSSYEAAAKELAAQERAYRVDIVKIEKQIANLKIGKERAKQNVELNRKKMELQKAQNFAARKRAVQALAVKTVIDQENAKLAGELHALEAQQRMTDEETRKLENFVRMAQEERREMLARRSQTQVNIETQQRMQKTRRAQIDAYRKATRALGSPAAAPVQAKPESTNTEASASPASYRQSASLSGGN